MMARRRGRRRPHAGEGPWRLLRVETGLEVACAHAQSVDEHRREARREAEKGSGSRIGRRVRSPWRPRARQTHRVDHLEEDRAADGHLRTRRAAKEQKGGLGDVSRRSPSGATVKDFMDQDGGVSDPIANSELITRVPGSGFETSGHMHPTSIRTLASKLLAPSAQQLPGGSRLVLGPRGEGRGSPEEAGQPASITRGSDERSRRGCRATEAPRGAEEGDRSTIFDQVVGTVRVRVPQRLGVGSMFTCPYRGLAWAQCGDPN